MKTSLEIPENDLRDVMRYTGAKTKREAIVTAVVEFNRRHAMAELVKFSGQSNTLLSNEDIEAADASDSRNWKKSAHGGAQRR